MCNAPSNDPPKPDPDLEAHPCMSEGLLNEGWVDRRPLPTELQNWKVAEMRQLLEVSFRGGIAEASRLLYRVAVVGKLHQTREEVPKSSTSLPRWVPGHAIGLSQRAPLPAGGKRQPGAGA